eukprot:GHVR01087580.1.p1 GENE.GHVR01087580.1~~GHVR01087580.1.p1  ORF type:complete len:181 (+),score=29.00 GHVR01087580.1:208-750(+)
MIRHDILDDFIIEEHLIKNGPLKDLNMSSIGIDTIYFIKQITSVNDYFYDCYGVHPAHLINHIKGYLDALIHTECAPLFIFPGMDCSLNSASQQKQSFTSKFDDAIWSSNKKTNEDAHTRGLSIPNLNSSLLFFSNQWRARCCEAEDLNFSLFHLLKSYVGVDCIIVVLYNLFILWYVGT